MNPQDPKYLQILKSIASPEQNYFAHFAMRYPVYPETGQNQTFFDPPPSSCPRSY